MKLKQLAERKNYTSGYTGEYSTKCFKIGKLTMNKISSNAAIRMNYTVSESESDLQDFGDIFLNVNTHEGEKINKIEVVTNNPRINNTKFFLKVEKETSTDIIYSFYVFVRQAYSVVSMHVNNIFISSASFIPIHNAEAEDYKEVTSSGGIFNSTDPSIISLDNTDDDKINFWSEIGMIKFDSKWQKCGMILDILNISTSDIPLRGGRLYIRAAQGADFPNDPIVALALSANINIDKEDIKAVVTADNNKSFIKIFIKVKDYFNSYICKPITITNTFSFTLYENKPLVENLPIGAVINCQ